MDLESEEDEPSASYNPYKLEGIYKDEVDRAEFVLPSISPFFGKFRLRIID